MTVGASPQAAWYDWFGLNTSLFRAINGLDAPALDVVMLGFTTFGHPSIYPYYVAAALLFSRARPAALAPRNVVVFALGYVLTSMILVPAMKSGFDFPRPLAVLGESVVRLVGQADPGHSFPSGHAAFAVLTAASLAPGAARPLRVALVAYAALVAVSRIAVGAHFPADVLAGALVGFVVALACRALVVRRADP